MKKTRKPGESEYTDWANEQLAHSQGAIEEKMAYEQMLIYIGRLKKDHNMSMAQIKAVLLEIIKEM